MLVAQCKACGRRFTAPDQVGNRRVRCQCGHVTQLSRLTPTEETANSQDAPSKVAPTPIVHDINVKPFAPQNLLAQIGAIPGVFLCFVGVLLASFAVFLSSDYESRYRIACFLVGLISGTVGGIAVFLGLRDGRLLPFSLLRRGRV